MMDKFRYRVSKPIRQDDIVLTVRLLVSLFWAVSQALAQAPGPFQVDTRLAIMDVQVLTSDTSLPIEGLTANDFIVRDEDLVKPLFSADFESTPLDFVVMLDVSTGHLVEPYRGGGGDTLLAVLSALAPEDRAAVISYGKKVSLKSTFTADSKVTQRALMSASQDRRSGRTDRTCFFSALREACGLFREQTSQEQARRRVVVVITSNGLDRGQMSSELEEKVLAERLVLYGLVVPRPYDASGEKQFGIAIPSIGKIIRRSTKSMDRGMDAHTIDSTVVSTGGELLHYEQLDSHSIKKTLSRLFKRYVISFRGEVRGPDSSLRRVTISLSPEAQSRYPLAKIVAAKTYSTR